VSFSEGSSVLLTLRAEYSRYRALAEAAIAQLTDAELNASSNPDENSIVMICWHISGNLRSRFTDFLTTDGEKPWRHRDEEFDARQVSRDDLLAKWRQGWDVLFDAMDSLSEADLERTVAIRAEPLSVQEALLRSVTHVSYHVGQIVYLAKRMCGNRWQSLTIPRGQSEAFNARIMKTPPR